MKRVSLQQPCKVHDFPDGARFCIQCGAEETRALQTIRLSLEERALSGDGDLYVTREEYIQIQTDYRTAVFFADEPTTFFLGRRIIVQD